MNKKDGNWYEELFDAVFQFVAILDSNGTVIKVNQAARELTQLSQTQVIGQVLWDIPWKGLSKTYKQQIKRAVKQAAGGDFARMELVIHLRRKPGNIFDFTFKPIRDKKNALAFIIVEGRDISFYKQTRAELVESNSRFEAIYDKAGIGIVIKGADGKIMDCNPAFTEMLGYPLNEIRELDYIAITHPKDRSISRKLFNELQTGKRNNYSVEKRYLSKSGETIWASVTATVMRSSDKKAGFTIVMAENITSQKLIEAELIELRQRLMQGREMERLKIAQDLHDGPLQEILGVAFQLKDLESVIPDGTGRELLDEAQTAIQKVSKSIRTICSDLRPSTLMPFGLKKAMLSHSEEFHLSHPELSLELDLAPDGQKLPEEVRLALFRIYQEALNNVIRHAEAGKVNVNFWFTDNEALLEIKDDGVGFKPPERWIELARKGHLGLVGCMERARDVGGQLNVISAEGKGTFLRVEIPLKMEANQNG